MRQLTGLKLLSVATHKSQKVFPISYSFACFINKRSFDVKVNGSHSFREGFYGRVLHPTLTPCPYRSRQNDCQLFLMKLDRQGAPKTYQNR